MLRHLYAKHCSAEVSFPYRLQHIEAARSNRKAWAALPSPPQLFQDEVAAMAASSRESLQELCRARLAEVRRLSSELRPFSTYL